MQWRHTRPTLEKWESGDYKIIRHVGGALSVHYRETAHLGGCEILEDAKLMCSEHAEGVARYFSEQDRKNYGRP
jgi:hypothetical protein